MLENTIFYFNLKQKFNSKMNNTWWLKMKKTLIKAYQ